jgi:hypothetical protein
MDYDNITPKQEMLMICEDIKNNCDRLTSGNFMHNKAAIKLLVSCMVNAINRAFPEEKGGK